MPLGREQKKRPKRPRCDKYGVPEYSTQDLENRAEEVLKFFGCDLDRPCATPIDAVIKRLSKEFAVRVDIQADLGTKDGHKILGRFAFESRTILVDRSLQNDIHRLYFTFAHELGHLVLHRNLKLKGDWDPTAITDVERDLVTGKKVLSTPRDWIEWQANSFAAGFLMPRATVRQAVVQAQVKIGIVGHIGLVYLDKQACNMRDFLLTLEHLMSVYSVSRAAAKCRLADLRILIDSRLQDVKHVSQLLRSEE